MGITVPGVLVKSGAIVVPGIVGKIVSGSLAEAAAIRIYTFAAMIREFLFDVMVRLKLFKAATREDALAAGLREHTFRAPTRETEV